MSRDPRPPLIVIVGPTGVGKTEIAIQLAEKLGGEIVSADSRLFYRGMDIGTAKPSLAERRQVPHHLIDVANPDQVWSLALFQREAHRTITSIQVRGCLPFLVGGTGQFVRAVIEGWEVPPAQPHPHLRKVLESWTQEITPAGLHARLGVLDPTAASLIDPRNLRRTIRALEVILSTGRRFSEQRKRAQSPYRSLMVGLNRPRPELYERIDQRIQAMFEAGFIDEVRHLLEAGYPPDLPCFSAIGYSQVIAYLQGKTSLDEAIILIKRSTRIYVRRQANWFKAEDPEIRWLQVDSGTVEKAESLIRQWLRTD